MTKADLVEQVAEAIGPGVTKRDCALIVDGFLGAVKKALATGERTMKKPPAVQLARVRKVVACRPPRRPSLAVPPPPMAASPPPFPDWRRMTTVRKSPSRMRTASRNPYMDQWWIQVLGEQEKVALPTKSVNKPPRRSGRRIPDQGRPHPPARRRRRKLRADPLCYPGSQILHRGSGRPERT